MSTQSALRRDLSRTLAQRAAIQLAFWSSLVGMTVRPLAADEPSSPNTGELRTAIERSLPLLARAATGHREQRTCFACHNQGLPVITLTAAAARGFAIDQAELQRQLEHTSRFLARNRDNYREGKGQGGQVDTAGYALWTLSAGERPPDETTSAVIEYLLRRDNDRDHWVNASQRPPSEASPFTTTYVALRAFMAYGDEEQRPRLEERQKQVAEWLKTAAPRDHEDRVFRLFSLTALRVSDDLRRAASRELLERQRADGGWAQLDAGEPASATESDAYATGSALVALLESRELAPDALECRRALSFLLRSQQPDGSWRVVSRSKPFQAYFESGYPHGKDQFISCAAGAWATLALLRALPAVEPSGAVNSP